MKCTNKSVILYYNKKFKKRTKINKNVDKIIP